MNAIIESVEFVESIDLVELVDLGEIAEPVEMVEMAEIVEIGVFKGVTWLKLDEISNSYLIKIANLDNIYESV